MQEQNFEQQVRQKMDELSLVPSAPVWNKVEEEIRKKKDRRRIVLWLLPFALLSAGIIWWSVSTNRFDSTITSQKTEPADATLSNKDAKQINRTVIPREIKKLQSKKEPRIVSETNTPGLIETNYVPYSFTTKARTKNFENEIDRKTFDSTKKINEKLLPPDISVLEKEKLQQYLTKTNHINTLNKPAVSDNLVITKKEDIKEIESQIKEKPIDTAEASEQMDAQKLQVKKANKLQFGVTAQVGFSGITSGLFDGFGGKSLAEFSSPIQNGSGGGTVLSPSTIKHDLFYSVGFTISKGIKTRSIITTGLQYQYYSTGINVGTKTDSVLSNSSRADFSYYRNDTRSNDYTNRFHFITLPVSYQYQIIKKLPLQIGAGISISQLLSSNALHYNSSGNLYYKDNSRLNKTQVAFFTGATYKLWKQRNFSLDVGPQLNYNLTPLQKNSNLNKQHLFSMGLNTQVNF